MVTWSTDCLPQHQRFDHWREERGRQLFGVTIELPPDRRPAFKGRFSAQQIGGATLASMSASAYRVSRTEADIDRIASDSLIIGLQMDGPGWCETPAGRSYVAAGGVAIGHSDLPSHATPATSDDFLIRMLKIPLDRIEQGRDAARGLFTAPVQHRGHAALVDAAISSLAEDGDTLPENEASGAVASIARLALLARGAVSAGSFESRQALRFGHLHAARRIMRRDLHRHDLTPDAVAAALGISLRQLHVIFEPSGISFQRQLTAIRIQEACRRLSADPHASVLTIALACGFDSLATFYRAFRRKTGGTPGDFRSS